MPVAKTISPLVVPDRAVWLAHIHLSVFENKNGILRVKHHGFGIILVHQNPLIVKVFVPRIAAG